MLIRALIVLLLVLNLGVALWWAMRTPPPLEPAFEADPEVAQLQLVDEAPAAAAAAPVAVAPRPRRCLSLGPFADAAALAQARGQLPDRVLESRERREFTGTPDGWRVFLPPLPSIEQSEAAAQRIADAGFADYYVIRDGAEAGAVALGLYGNEASALTRAGRLRGAGFAARVEPTGAGPVRHWLDLVVAAGFDADAAQARTGVAQAQPLDCRALQEPGP